MTLNNFWNPIWATLTHNTLKVHHATLWQKLIVCCHAKLHFLAHWVIWKDFDEDFVISQSKHKTHNQYKIAKCIKGLRQGHNQNMPHETTLCVCWPSKEVQKCPRRCFCSCVRGFRGQDGGARSRDFWGAKLERSYEMAWFYTHTRDSSSLIISVSSHVIPN